MADSMRFAIEKSLAWAKSLPRLGAAGLTADESLRVANAQTQTSDDELAAYLGLGARVDSVAVQELLDQTLINAASGLARRSKVVWGHSTAPAELGQVRVPAGAGAAACARWAEAALAAGADPNAVSVVWSHGRGEWSVARTAMELAASSGQVGVAAALMKAGAVADARGDDGWTPLMWASAGGQVEMVAMLAPLTADLRSGGEAGCSAKDLAFDPLDLAASAKIVEILGREEALREAEAIGRAASAGASRARLPRM